MVMIIALLANLTYIQIFDSDTLRKHPTNRRTILAEYNRERGQIITSDGIVIARSDPSDDNFRFQRSYPKGEEYAAITGYYSQNYGATGIEQAYNEVLAGNSPQLVLNQLGDTLTGRDPRGGNVELTIAPKIQSTAYEAMVAKGYVGSVVALRPQTGQVLAMVSTPAFNPNPLASHSAATQEQAYAQLVTPKDPKAPSRQVNRSIGALYPPGSTFKLVIGAAALQNGYTPDSPVTTARKITLPGTDGATLSNYAGGVCGGSSSDTISLTLAMAHSCNTAFAQVGMNLGAAKIREQAAAFGVGPQQPPLAGLKVAASKTGPMADSAAVAQSSIGQRDVLLTPMELAIIGATIANKGQRMEPYLVEKLTNPDLSVLEQFEPKVAGQAIPQEVALHLGQMMVASEQAMSIGTDPNLHIASKTGTAEWGTDPKNSPPHAWYVAYAPVDNPQIAVAVLVEKGGDRGLNAVGATVAGPIGQAVIAAALKGAN